MFVFFIYMLVAVVVLGTLYFGYLLFVFDVFETEIPSTPSPVIAHDDLTRAILSLINDTYSPFYEAKLTDHLLSDLDIDSLDMVDLLFDVSHIANTKLNAKALYDKYGRNPTIAQLIAYTRSEMKHPSAP